MTRIANKQHTFSHDFHLGISNRLRCSRAGQTESTKAKRAQHRASTMCYKTTNFFGHLQALWIIQRYKGVWNGLTSVLPFPIHSELTVFLLSANMLLSLACLWTLPHNVSSEQFWWIISSCTRLTAGHTHVGASSGLGRVFSHRCGTDTCSLIQLNMTWERAADIKLCV